MHHPTPSPPPRPSQAPPQPLTTSKSSRHPLT
jgi:hypothetical protein